MKYLFLIAAALCLGSAALAQDGQEIVVRGGDETTAAVFPIAPGIAEVEMGPVYGVFLGPAPETVRVRHHAPDRSGKGEASVGAILPQTLRVPTGVCWIPIRMALAAEACAPLELRSVRVTVNVGGLRDAPFGMYPVFVNPETGVRLAFAAHPENTQTLMRCERGTDMASVFYVDAEGLISIATSEQMRRYADQYCGRS